MDKKIAENNFSAIVEKAFTPSIRIKLTSKKKLSNQYLKKNQRISCF